MGNPIGKGEYTTPTGLDTIADTLNTYGQNQVDARYDGHHTVQNIVDGITNFQTKSVSKTCKILRSDIDENDNYTPDRLIVGNATIPLFKEDSDGNYTISALEGDIYVDINGNITTS